MVDQSQRLTFIFDEVGYATLCDDSHEIVVTHVVAVNLTIDEVGTP